MKWNWRKERRNELKGVLSERMKVYTYEDVHVNFATMPLPYKGALVEKVFIDNKRQKAYVFGGDGTLCIYSFETSKWEKKNSRIISAINSTDVLEYYEEWDLITTKWGNLYLDYNDMNMKDLGLECSLHNTIWREGTYALVFEDIYQPYVTDKFIFYVFDPIKRDVNKVVLPFKKERAYQVEWTDKGLAIRTYTERKYKKGEYVYKNELWYKWDSSNEHYFTPVEDFTPNKFYDLPFVTPKSSNADVIQMSDNFFE